MEANRTSEDAEREARAVGPTPVYHGGDLAQARTLHPQAPTPWIDLSTGINPCPYPLPPLPPQAWTRLPEAAEVAALERVAAEAFDVHDPALIAATPGTQALIQMLPRLLAGPRVAILGFTYQEHARVWREAGREVAIVDDLAACAAADVAVVVNPNNPDGRLVPAGDLAALALRMQEHGGRLIVDEAFVDVLEGEVALAPRLPLGRAVVLRSFGKTWGLAGLRLGFAIGDADFAEALRRAFGPWAVSGPAIAVAKAALADRDWLATERRRLAAAASRLDALLLAAGLAVIGGTPLYRLAVGDHAATLLDRLGAAGIHVRRFPHDSRLLRFGLPGTACEWDRLAAALAPTAE